MTTLKVDKKYTLTLQDGTEIVLEPDEAYFIWTLLDPEFKEARPYQPIWVDPISVPTNPPFYPTTPYWYVSNIGGNT